MKRLITFAAMFALLSVTNSAFAQRGDKANDKQGQGQQQDQRERRGGNDGQKAEGVVVKGRKAVVKAVVVDCSDCWTLTAMATCRRKRSTVRWRL